MRVRQEFQRTTNIVIPTGRNGFCFIIPCALFCGLYTATGVGALALVWHRIRRRFRREIWLR